jgi:hypothetical protein
VGTTDACSAALDLDAAVALARVERTLLSVAFDVAVAFDVEGFVSGYAFRACPERSRRAYRKPDTTVEERRFSAA